MTEQTLQQTISIAARLNYLFYILVLGAVIFVIVLFGVGGVISNVTKLANHNIYVSVSSWDVPLIVGLPCFFAMAYVLCLRFLNMAREQRIQKALKVAVVFAIAAIVTRLLYGFVIAAFLSYKGYSSCWQYSSPQVMSPTVWVNNSDFCIAHSGSVRRDILGWMDTLPNAGSGVSVDEVKVKVAELLNQRKPEKH